MRLIELKEVDKTIYNNFVAAQPSGSFLQAWEWGDWQTRLKKQVRRFFLQGENDQTLLSAQVIVTSVFRSRYFIYFPYGPVINSNVEISIGDFEFFLDELKKYFPKAVFIRVEPKTFFEPVSRFGHKTSNIQPAKTLILDLRHDLDFLLTQMHHKTRYNIRLAQKHGVEVQKEFGVTVGHGLYVKEALGLLAETAKRQGYVGHPQIYYKGLLDFFALYKEFSQIKIHVYKAIYKKQLLASALMVDFGTTRYFLFGGSSNENKNLMAPYLLHYRAMADAKENGLEIYDFWGIETSSGELPGFVRFKLGFGGQVAEYSGAKDFINSKLWYNIYTLIRTLNHSRRKIIK